MAENTIDLNKLATFLKSKMDEKKLSARAAAKEIGFGASTLSRLLQGQSNENVPDLMNISRAANWIGKSLSDFAVQTKQNHSTIADVEVHLRALPGLGRPEVEALVAMVKATYEHAKESRPKKR